MHKWAAFAGPTPRPILREVVFADDESYGNPLALYSNWLPRYTSFFFGLFLELWQNLFLSKILITLNNVYPEEELHVARAPFIFN